MKMTLYMTHSVLWSSSPSVRAVVSMIEWLGWKEPETIVGIEKMARASGGRFNPSGDFMLVAPDGEVIRNPVDFARWVDLKGLTPL